MTTLKKSAVFVLLLIMGSLYGCRGETNGSFDFTVLKAGQADAIIMQTENYSIIIDTGETDDGEKIVSFLSENGIESIDYLFITHFDKDHIGGFPEIMESVAAKNIIVPDYDGDSDEYTRYLKTIEYKELNVLRLEEDMTLTLDDVSIEVSVPEKKYYAGGDNDYSLVLSLTHGHNSFLFAGDAEEERLSEIISRFGTEYDFLKVPHHGRYNKITKQFIGAVKPKYAVITDSGKNPASDKTVSALEKAGCTVYSTKDGNVSVSSDGEKITIKQ